MKVCVCLTLVCCVLLCLFLSLPQSVGLKHGLQIVGSRPWFDREREPTSDASPVSVVTRIRFDLPRPAPLASLFLIVPGLRAILVHPAPRPLGHRNRSGLGKLPVKPSTPTNGSSTLFLRKLLAQITNLEESGFRNSL